MGVGLRQDHVDQYSWRLGCTDLGPRDMDGVDLANLGESELVRYRAEKIGFVFKQFHLVQY